MLIKKIKSGRDLFLTIKKQNDELIWAKTWDDTKRGIQWLNDLPSISPGRWAVGYNYLYVMTRILEEKQPHKILDLGLGISSTLITCYMAHHTFSDSKHIIVEQDEKWIDFYQKKHKLSHNSRILAMNLIERKFYDSRGEETYYAYEGFSEHLKGKSFSLVSVDGPWGSERHSRRDIVELIPGLLEDDWVIVIDDSERPGERETIREIENVLKNHNVKCHKGYYPGMTECCVITSDTNEFLCSM